VGPKSRSVRGGEEKNSQLLPAAEPPIIQPVVRRCTTELSRLLHLRNALLKFDIGHSDCTGLKRKKVVESKYFKKTLFCVIDRHHLPENPS
jgi:hypothetical protein